MEPTPFLFGRIVQGDQYCPRTHLEKRLISCLQSGQNAAVLGPRRVGKSSLLFRSAKMVKGLTLIYADLWGVHSLADLIRRCVQALDALEDKSGLLERIARALPGITVTVSVDPLTGAPSLTPTLGPRKQPAPESVAQVARLWASLAEGSRKIAVGLDEFQDLAGMEDAGQVLGVLRREIQTLTAIPFCFCGSIRSEMWRLFADERGPFYKSAAVLEVAADDFDDWQGYLRAKFERGKLKISDETLQEIIRTADGNPGDTQQLCAAVWEVSQGRSPRLVDSARLREALQLVFASERKGYEQIVADVSPQQLAVLRTIAQLGGESVQSAEFLSQAGITHASSSRAAASRLVQRRILEETPGGLRFSNPFFCAWLLHTRF